MFIVLFFHKHDETETRSEVNWMSLIGPRLIVLFSYKMRLPRRILKDQFVYMSSSPSSSSITIFITILIVFFFLLCCDTSPFVGPSSPDCRGFETVDFQAPSHICEKRILLSCLPVCQSAWQNSAATRLVFMKFGVWLFFKICWGNSCSGKIWQK
jgi:hypothetical protein